MSASSSPHLGLVCITTSKDVRYRTVTRKRLLEQSGAGQRKLLDDIYCDNLQTLDGSLQYCQREGIRLYRMPSSIFPFFDEDVGREVMAGLAPALARTGMRARARPAPGDASGPVRGAELGFTGRRRQQRQDPANARRHHGPPAAAALALGPARDPRRQSEPQRRAGCAHRRTRARATWPDPAWQLVHISNGREGFNDRQHADLITAMPASYARAPWIEIEAKLKEDAIAELRGWQLTC